ncbi:MAG: hypothetical protein ACLQUW_11465 [Desulfobaccales bacterium]
MLKRSRQWWMIGWVVVLVLGPGYLAAAEITGVYELRQKGEVCKLEVTEHRGTDSLQFVLYVQANNFSGSMFGLADLKGNTATYRTKGCQLTITFSGNQAVISNADTQCRDYLKPGILLDGTYIRKP